MHPPHNPKRGRTENSPISARARSERGQAAVEAVLVALVLIVTIFGIFDMAQIWFVCHTLTDRAQRAARRGALMPYSEAAVRNLVLYDQTSAPEGNPQGIFNLEPGMVSVTREGEGTDNDRVVVTVSGYPYKVFTPFLAGTLPNLRPIVVSVPYEGGT